MSRVHARWLLLTGLLVLWSLTTGCVGRLAANRLLGAPNGEAPHNPTNRAASWDRIRVMLTTNLFTEISIPVGPPVATLSAFEVPAGEYYRSFRSQVVNNPDGGGFISLQIETNKFSTFTPLSQPATMILLHGYGLSKESMALWAIVLAQAGFRVIAIDLRGHGQSTGPMIGFGRFETTDLTSALDYLRERGYCDERVGVLGVSYGATLALNWAARDKRVRAVVAIAPYDNPAVAFERFAAMAGVPIPRAAIRIGARAAARRLGIQWSDWSGSAAISHLAQPTFLVGGALDPITPPEDLRRMKAAAGGSVTDLVLPAANHYVVSACLDSLQVPVESWLRQQFAPVKGD